MDTRLRWKLIGLLMAAFLGGGQQYLPKDAPWWVLFSIAGLICVGTTLVGYLDTGIARVVERANHLASEPKPIKEEGESIEA